jgi:hypothetical protein
MSRLRSDESASTRAQDSTSTHDRLGAHAVVLHGLGGHVAGQHLLERVHVGDLGDDADPVRALGVVVRRGGNACTGDLILCAVGGMSNESEAMETFGGAPVSGQPVGLAYVRRGAISTAARRSSAMTRS